MGRVFSRAAKICVTANTISVCPSSVLKLASILEVNALKVATQNAMSLTFNAQTTAIQSITSAFQQRVVKNAGVIDLTAWIHVQLIIMDSVKTLVTQIITSVSQFSVLKHAWDTGRSAQIPAIRAVAH